MKFSAGFACIFCGYIMAVHHSYWMWCGMFMVCLFIALVGKFWYTIAFQAWPWQAWQMMIFPTSCSWSCYLVSRLICLTVCWQDLGWDEILTNYQLWLLYCRVLVESIWIAPLWLGPCLISCWNSWPCLWSVNALLQPMMYQNFSWCMVMLLAFSLAGSWCSTKGIAFWLGQVLACPSPIN